MIPVNLVLLTGPSAAGKTFLQRQLTANAISCLDNDQEVMTRFFDLLPKAEGDKYRAHIGNEAVWRPARSLVDYDRIVRLHHRDWYLRNECPKNFVAVGWMYSRRDHRHQVNEAFRRVPNISLNTKIVRLIPDENVFVERYIERQDKAQAEAWNLIVAKGKSACIEHAKEMLRNYLAVDWQAPTDDTTFEDVKALDDALVIIQQHFGSVPVGQAVPE
ncbi:MAG: hypothetical protein DWH91_06135 [Planctomycetota bacterium]|nr:MAG: hypothetical protein DWH91_06135 [Planctomycetota bacterium]